VHGAADKTVDDPGGGVMIRTTALVAFLSLALLSTADARLAISANDGKQILAGEAEGRTPDSISVIDLSATPKVIGTLDIPAAMIGPPNAVAVSGDESFAIVTAAQKFLPDDPQHPAAADRVSVIDLRDPAHPRLLQSLAAGADASGVALNRAGTLALVAAKAANAIFVFTVRGNHLSPAGRIALGDHTAPTDVVFAPDGRHAYAVTWDAGKVMELAIEGARVTLTGKDVVTGRQSYGAVVTPDNAWLINTNVGGAATGADHTGTLAMVNLKTHSLALSLPVGRTPEHVSLSPDGKYAALVLANGAATSKLDPKYAAVTGLLKVFAVGPGTLTPVTQAPSCHWAQGAAWRDDGHVLLQQCAAEREIQVFRFDGKSLVQDKSATMMFQSRPGSIATHLSR
jgi:DNA-binding beta-propeller fold protein YncE